MMKAARLVVLAVMFVSLVPAVVLVACNPHSQQEEQPAAEETPPAQQPAAESTQAAAVPSQCPTCAAGQTCSNYPFQRTDCWTTTHGPAKADVIEGPNNLLYCKQGAYALCFFSGPPTPTGKNPDNPPLPCVLKGDVANCTCQVYTAGPSFVDINGILNLGAWQQTVQVCGADGSGCANLANCGKDGSLPGCDKRTQAPVCQYVQNQDPNDPTVSLMPKADVISTFSPTAMSANYQLGSTPGCKGRYAGCMTAPCFYPKGAKQPASDGDPIQCECPTFDGPYQVGQFKQQCDIPSSNGTSYVWSAANNLMGGNME
ncbi:MAG TPA: hypothetical protein VGX68_26605 [Thermoanaerobaculia bacterium]|jgi:hypothetical protein|nr:hypothetical protein [Thermoanaerobaculia bacterium]